MEPKFENGDNTPLADLEKQSKVLHSDQIVELKCTLVDYSSDVSIDSSHCTLINSSFINYCIQLTNHYLWNLYFDNSRNTDGVDVGYLLINLYGIWTYFSYHLEYEYPNNDVEYETLIQGHGKEIDLNLKYIEVFHDS